MCGASSAIGLAESERELWPQVKERLRKPGHLMALMRGVLGGDTEVAAAVAVSPQGAVQPPALLVTPGIAEEIRLADTATDGICPGRIGDYDVDVLVGPEAASGHTRPLAVLMSPWIYEHLTLYTRKLWSRR